MERKIRKKPPKLKILEILNNRMTLPDDAKHAFLSLKKGYEGEVMFDNHLQTIESDYIILNDLLLQANNTTFQIDSLLLADEIHMFEVKNFLGDYYYEDERIYTKTGLEISSPFIQLSRAESLLRQLLQSLGLNITINASVVFINPEFTLYQAPLDKPAIYPAQVDRLIRKLNSRQPRITKRHKSIADKLVSMHMDESPYTKLPEYDYGQLRKGVCCEACGSFDVLIEGKNCGCTKCGYKEKVEDMILRGVDEFRLLFPEESITTRAIFDWCGGLPSMKSIRRILEKRYNLISIHRWSYFTEKQVNI